MCVCEAFPSLSVCLLIVLTVPDLAHFSQASLWFATQFESKPARSNVSCWCTIWIRCTVLLDTLPRLEICFTRLALFAFWCCKIILSQVFSFDARTRFLQGCAKVRFLRGLPGAGRRRKKNKKNTAYLWELSSALLALYFVSFDCNAPLKIIWLAAGRRVRLRECADCNLFKKCSYKMFHHTSEGLHPSVKLM